MKNYVFPASFAVLTKKNVLVQVLRVTIAGDGIDRLFLEEILEMVETRNILHGDGRLEVRRVISADNLEDWDHENPLAYERSIVWVSPVLDLPYVRSTLIKNARSRRGPLMTSGEALKVVGYSKLTADAPMHGADFLHYQRRLFYLTQEDLMGTADVRGKDNCFQPATILPTEWGEPFVPAPAMPEDIGDDSGIVEFAF